MQNSPHAQCANPYRLCHEMLPLGEVYSLTQIGDTWLAELKFDNLLHDGQGPSAADAVLDAITTIMQALKPLPGHPHPRLMVINSPAISRL